MEGKHDAELVEKVWGDDLRAEGVVVEFLQGVDLLESALRAEPPSAERRYGVLVDHLVPGSKESRIADAIARGAARRSRPDRGSSARRRSGSASPRARWASTRGRRCRAASTSRSAPAARFGWPSETPADLARAWQRILGRVSSYRDLDPALLGRVEELIDFVTA